MPRSVIRVTDGVIPWNLTTQVGAKGDPGAGGISSVTAAGITDSTAAGRALLTAAAVSNQRTALGLNSGAPTTTGKNLVTATDAAAARTVIDAASTSSVAAKLDASGAQAALAVDDASLGPRLTTLGRPQLIVIGSGDPVPAVTNGAFLATLSGAVTGSIGVTSLLAESKTGSTSVASTSLSALGSGAVVVVLVTSYLSGATSGSPAPACTGLSGAGLTWTAVSLPATVTTNGNDTAKLFVGTGTGTSGALTATFGSAPTTAQFRVSQLTNATGTVVQATSATVTAGTGTPTISLPSSVLGTSITLCWIVQNNASNANNPDPTFTEIGSAVSATGIRVSGEYKVPSTQTATWTTPVSPSSYQKLLVIAEVS